MTTSTQSIIDKAWYFVRAGGLKNTGFAKECYTSL
jgi:hypothetical protein